MQKGKNAMYVTAGLQAAPGMRIHVRSSVQLPDSEAGQAFDPGRQPFRAGHVAAAPRESVTVPLRGALIFLCALFVTFGGLIVSKNAQRSELVKYIGNMLHLDLGTSIRTNNTVLAELARCYPATIELALFSIVIAAVFGIFFGIISASQNESSA